MNVFTLTCSFYCALFLGTNQTIRMTQKMASVGADSVLVATPCFYKSGMTSEALQKHYTKVYMSSNITTANT